MDWFSQRSSINFFKVLVISRQMKRFYRCSNVSTPALPNYLASTWRQRARIDLDSTKSNILVALITMDCWWLGWWKVKQSRILQLSVWLTLCQNTLILSQWRKTLNGKAGCQRLTKYSRSGDILRSKSSWNISFKMNYFTKMSKDWP